MVCEEDITLGEVITAVPQLGTACSLALTHVDTPGSGIKLMRLLSKQLSTAMLGAVQGYTLHLDGSGGRLLNQTAFLHGIRLSCLRVVVTEDSKGESKAGIAACSLQSI